MRADGVMCHDFDSSPDGFGSLETADQAKSLDIADGANFCETPKPHAPWNETAADASEEASSFLRRAPEQARRPDIEH